MTPWLSRAFGFIGHLVALDIKPNQIELARQKALESGVDIIEFLTASERPLKKAGVISEESFEAVLADLAGWRAGDGDYYALSRQFQVCGERY